MEFFKTPNFDLIGKRKIFYSISIAIGIITCLAVIYRRGLNPSIDFTGGTLIQGFFKSTVSMKDIRSALDGASLGGGELQSIPERNAVIIRFKSEAHAKQQVGNQITEALNKAFPSNSFTVERVEFVGPVVGRHLVGQAMMAFIFSMLGISVYVAFRFKKWVWGITGVFALVHDVFFTVGFMAIMGREMSISVMAALLTIAGYSINDTIVIFDRIRENLRNQRNRKEDIGQLMNRSFNETLSRTIITSLTVFIVLIALLIFGGEVIRDFTLAMTFGVVVGTYSSIFVASAMVYDWQKKRKTPLW
jgi:preprotein translocase SecF subunit